MSSLDWSKKYEVLGISRVYLRSLGFTNEQINILSDEDMQRIADTLNNTYFMELEEDVKFVVSLELADKGVYNQPTGKEGSHSETSEQ